MAAKILCIGEALMDMMCTDTGKTLADGKHFVKKAGGAPANVAAAIAALGGTVELAAKVGADPFGTHLIQVMQSLGISTRWVVQDAASFTTFAYVSLLENGEHDFYFNRGADGLLSTEEVERIDLDDVSILHFGSATAFLPGPLQAAYHRLLQKATEQNIFISFDPNYRPQLFGNNIPHFIAQSRQFLQKCHFFKVSEEEALLLTGSSDLETAVNLLFEMTDAPFAVTLGKNGALLGLNGAAYSVPGVSVQPVDTTGAGDAFVGSVLYQLSTKTRAEIAACSPGDWQHIMANANKAGAKVCGYMGAMEAYQHLKDSV